MQLCACRGFVTLKGGNVACKRPSDRTLAKYGMDGMDWLKLMIPQAWACKICKRSFKEVRHFIDHNHVKGFKNMPAQMKRQHVRGLLCFTCNRYRVAKNTLETASRVFEYLSGKPVL